MTGGLAWVVSYPFDTIKTVMQGSSIVGTTDATNTVAWGTASQKCSYAYFGKKSVNASNRSRLLGSHSE